jgi:hypothetical protein
MAEREGFEPPVPFSITSFQDWRLKPLGHLSTVAPDPKEALEYSNKMTAACQPEFSAFKRRY